MLSFVIIIHGYVGMMITILVKVKQGDDTLRKLDNIARVRLFKVMDKYSII